MPRAIPTLAAALIAGACGHRPAPNPEAPIGGGPAPSAPLADAWYLPGEQLAWDLQWGRVRGGTARLAAGAPGHLAGAPALFVHSAAESGDVVSIVRRVRDELTTAVDLRSGAPLRNEEILEIGRKRRRVRADFSAGEFRGADRVAGDGEHTWRQRAVAGGGFDDLHTALARLRAWEPPETARGALVVQSGRNVYRVEVVAAGGERIDTPAGAFDCRRIDGTATLAADAGRPPARAVRRTFHVWISADRRRLPVQIAADTSFGQVRAALTGYRQPDAGAAIRVTSASPRAPIAPSRETRGAPRP